MQPDQIKSDSSWCKYSEPFSFLIYQKEISKWPPNIIYQKHIKISTAKLRRFSIHRNYIQKVHRKNMEFLPVKITSKELHWNDAGFLPIEITSSKACRNNVELLPIKVARKKFLEMTWKFVYILFLTYHHNIKLK